RRGRAAGLSQAGPVPRLCIPAAPVGAEPIQGAVAGPAPHGTGHCDGFHACSSTVLAPATRNRESTLLWAQPIMISSGSESDNRGRRRPLAGNGCGHVLSGGAGPDGLAGVFGTRVLWS